MAVVNVTPDSFSDGGRHEDAGVATDAALRFVTDGAAIVDVGGESTRPGSDGVGMPDELARVLPVIAGVRRVSAVPISIDTSKAPVADAAIAAGATFVNDVTALGDPALAAVVAEHGVDLCLMHMQGTPRTMQIDPRYEDVVSEVGDFLAERVERAVSAGVSRHRICVDPGIGFGKTVAHNVALIAGSRDLERRTGCPVLVGLSRKSFLGRIIGDLDRDRTVATVVANLEAVRAGAWMLRVHDVLPHVDAVAIHRRFREAADV